MQPMSARARAALVCLVLAVFVGASARAANAAFPGANGEIYFFGFVPTAGAGELQAMNGDGTGVHRIIGYRSPAFSELDRYASSPDGSRLVIESGRDIWELNADGSGLTDVVAGATTDRNPSWVPGGKRILYDHGVHGRLVPYVANADGSHARRLLRKAPCGALAQFCQPNPVWSVKGRVAVVSDRDARGDNEIWAMNPDGSDPVELTHTPGTYSDLDWSPDGGRLAFTRDNHIFIVSASGGDEAQLATGVPDLATEGWPSWSPDGTAMAFAGVRFQAPPAQQSSSAIYVLKLAPSATATAITPGTSETRPAWRPLVQGPPVLPPLVEHYLTIQSRHVALSRKGVAGVRMRCDPADACNGKVGLVTSAAVACGHGHKRRVSLGTGRVRLSPFQTATVHVRLNHRARELVRCLGTVRTRAIATLRPTDAQSSITVRRSISLRAPR